MRKYIEIPMEVLECLLSGKCVEGSLRYDAMGGSRRVQSALSTIVR